MRCFTAIGVYLRRFVIDNMQKPGSFAAETPFGKFILAADAEARDSLYQKKITFEPSAAIARVTSYTTTTANANMGQVVSRQFDMARI